MEIVHSAMNGESPRHTEPMADMLENGGLLRAERGGIQPISEPRLVGVARSSRRPAKVAPNIDVSISYMKEHLDQPLKASVLAAEAKVSLSHYFALFKQQTGFTPIDYFIQLRMQRACELLNATSLSVKEVAAALGYEDPFYFSRVFKHVNQVAPSYYRRKAGGETCRMV